MSSNRTQKRDTMPIRIDSEVHQWVTVLKEAYGVSSVSDAIREVIKRTHPDIEQYVQVLEEQDEKRANALRDLMMGNTDSEG